MDLHIDMMVKWVVGLYGKNLLDEVGHGVNGLSRSPTSGFGSFSPLSKGRVFGLQLILSLYRRLDIGVYSQKPAR